MKKNYLTPQMEIDVFDEEDILCASGGGVTVTPDTDIDEGEFGGDDDDF